MGRTARPGNRVHAFYPLGPHAVELVVGDGHQIAFPRARPDRLRNIQIRSIDHGGGLFQQFDLFFGFDLACIHQRLLTIDHVDTFGFEGAQHGQFHNIDAEWLLFDAEIDHLFFDLLGEYMLDAVLRRQGALHGRDWRIDPVAQPGRAFALGRRCRVP